MIRNLHNKKLRGLNIYAGFSYRGRLKRKIAVFSNRGRLKRKTVVFSNRGQKFKKFSAVRKRDLDLSLEYFGLLEGLQKRISEENTSDSMGSVSPQVAVQQPDLKFNLNQEVLQILLNMIYTGFKLTATKKYRFCRL